MKTSKDPTTFVSFETYSVTSLIGEGGSGRVFRAQNASGNIVAIKSLNPSKLTSERIKRFKNETHFCLRCTHKNIVPVLDYGMRIVDTKQCPFYVMPYYPQTLRRLIDDGLEINEVLPYFAQILDGVEAAHLLGVWHRDLKPENILIDPDSMTVVIADFGVARFIKEDLYTLVETRPTTRLANFQYAAPEQRRRGAVVDSRADIFALGLILNEMFTREVIQGTSFKTIESVSPDLAYLDAIVNEMRRQTPNERPASIDSIKQAMLARENDFVSRQKLDALKNRVIPHSEVDDPLVLDPIRVIAVDYDRGDLVFKLNKEPSTGWENLFKRMTNVPIRTSGESPESIRFFGTNALLELLSPQYAQDLIDLFKTYVETCNDRYAQQVDRRQQEEQAALKAKLKRQIEEEELRQEILNTIKL